MKKLITFVRRQLKKLNVRVGLGFALLVIAMARLYFELGQLNRMILLFNMAMFLLISGYLLLNKSVVKKTGKSLMHPIKLALRKVFRKKNKKSGYGRSDDSKEKSRIYYSRTYRHLKVNYWRIGLFFIFFVIPAVVLFLLSYSDISRVVVEQVQDIAVNYIDAEKMSVGRTEFLPLLGDLYYISVEGFLPSKDLSLMHLLITLFVGIIVNFSFKNSMHVRMYLFVFLFIHLTSSVYMYFLADKFPYTLSDYSELYMKQQIGIWLSIFTIITLLSGVINYTGFSKFVFVLTATIYSFVFGIIRYAVFLGVMHNFSVIYMTTFFFSLGPFIDFLYLVWMYSLFMRFITARFSDGRGVVKWYWA